MTSIFLVTMFFSLSLSLFLSGMEAGVFALSQLRIRRLVRQGNRNARTLSRFLSRPEDFLWTILVGNTLSNFTAASLVVYASRAWVREQPLLFGISFTGGLLLFYAACELLPKMIFRTYPNRLCLLFARPFRLVHALLKPLVAIVRWLATGLMQWSGGRTFTAHLFGNRDELRRLMDESAHEFSSEEQSMIRRVLDLQAFRVGHVMVPLQKVVIASMSMSVADAMRLCRETGVSRLPVLEEGAARRIVGLVNLRTLLYQTDMAAASGRRVSDFVQPATFVDVDMRLDEAMRHLQRTGQRLAIVLARDRRELGIVSLQDILKAIFGQVRL
jgi:putative hemolysin